MEKNDNDYEYVQQPEVAELLRESTKMRQSWNSD